MAEYFRKGKAVFNSFALLLMNSFKALRLNSIRPQEVGGVFYQGAPRESLDDCYSIHRLLNDNHDFSWTKKALYWLFSKKLVFCAVEDGEIVAVAFYCFNFRDFFERSV